jgi:hypothetical protein
VVCVLQVFPDEAVVVDLAIDGKNNVLIGAGDGLSAGL